MSKPVIEVKNLSKMYSIGHEQKVVVGNVTFRDTLMEVIHKPIELLTGRKLDKEKFWALRNVSFSINKGEIVAIIGRNGSGKSTMLKVLSRIVEPTEGEITMRGKVASLLEVGTGFHPELTGRENIFFNGAILGMKQSEIRAKFQEIVEFSEVEKFLDTPVKFYSSGMYVRLAFAVAAHLEPDILIVDEVLAVGDAAFQKKCLGKISDVASEGRTVIFVSHSMDTVKSLCQRAILMKEGNVEYDGDLAGAIDMYQNATAKDLQSKHNYKDDEAKTAIIRKVNIKNRDDSDMAVIGMDSPWHVSIEYVARQLVKDTIVSLEILSSEGEVVYMTTDADLGHESLPSKEAGNYSSSLSFDKDFLTPGTYSLRIAIQSPGKELYDQVDNIAIEIIPDHKDLRNKYFAGRYMGYLGQKTEWQTIKK